MVTSRTLKSYVEVLLESNGSSRFHKKRYPGMDVSLLNTFLIFQFVYELATTASTLLFVNTRRQNRNSNTAQTTYGIDK